MVYEIIYTYSAYSKKFESKSEEYLLKRLSTQENDFIKGYVEKFSQKNEFQTQTSTIHYVFFVFLFLISIFLTTTTRVPLILIPFLYLFAYTWWKETKLSALKDFVEIKSKEWRGFKLDLDIEMRFEKEFFINWWILGIFFHIYNFELRFALNGSHMDQLEIESGISTANLGEPSSNMMVSATSFDKHETNNLMGKYKFKTNKFKSIQRHCDAKIRFDEENSGMSNEIDFQSLSSSRSPEKIDPIQENIKEMESMEFEEEIESTVDHKLEIKKSDDPIQEHIQEIESLEFEEEIESTVDHKLEIKNSNEQEEPKNASVDHGSEKNGSDEIEEQKKSVIDQKEESE